MLFLWGAIFGAALLGLLLWIHSKSIKMDWYVYLAGAIGLFLFIFTIQNYLGALREGEDAASLWYLLVFGIPAIILLALASLRVWNKNKALSKKAS